MSAAAANRPNNQAPKIGGSNPNELSSDNDFDWSSAGRASVGGLSGGSAEKPKLEAKTGPQAQAATETKNANQNSAAQSAANSAGAPKLLNPNSNNTNATNNQQNSAATKPQEENKNETAKQTNAQQNPPIGNLLPNKQESPSRQQPEKNQPAQQQNQPAQQQNQPAQQQAQPAQQQNQPAQQQQHAGNQANQGGGAQNPTAQARLQQQNQRAKDSKDSTSMKWRNMTIFLIIVTVILIVSFLGVLIFMNCVPQINGIPLARTVSIGYFLQSILSLLLLFFYFEIVSYTMKEFLNVNRFVSMVYGVLLIVLGILVIVFEVPLAKRNSESIWDRLSENQKNFFDDKSTQLRNARVRNSFYVASFAIVIGVGFLIVGVGMFLLNRDLQQKHVRGTSSRLPDIEMHECVVFEGFTTLQPEHDTHHMRLRDYYPYPQIDQADEEQAHNSDGEESQFDYGDDNSHHRRIEAQEDFERQRLEMQYGNNAFAEA